MASTLWAQRYPEKRAAQKKRHYEKHKEKIKARERLRWKINGAQIKDENKKNPARVRGIGLKYRHGLTLEIFNRMATAQNNLCAICGKPGPECCNGVLHVDHDHVTGKIRGLLCDRCNRMLGLAKDRPSSLRRAAEYLIASGINASD